MKKILALLMALVMLFSVATLIAGCEDSGKKKNSSSKNDDDEDEDEEEEEDEGTEDNENNDGNDDEISDPTGGDKENNTEDEKQNGEDDDPVAEEPTETTENIFYNEIDMSDVVEGEIVIVPTAAGWYDDNQELKVTFAIVNGTEDSINNIVVENITVYNSKNEIIAYSELDSYKFDGSINHLQYFDKIAFFSDEELFDVGGDIRNIHLTATIIYDVVEE